MKVGGGGGTRNVVECSSLTKRTLLFRGHQNLTNALSRRQSGKAMRVILTECFICCQFKDIKEHIA